MEIEQFTPDILIHGLLSSEDYVHRVAGSCTYQCPHCGHRIRFKWRNFYKADERSFLKKFVRQAFDEHTPIIPSAELGFLDFHCPSCQTPARIIFTADDYTKLAFHFEITKVLVGKKDISR